MVLEANIDDSSGEWVGHCVGRLLEHVALDAYCVPIYMKKNRPAVVLTVICERSSVAELESVIFAETSTFGIRRHLTERTKLERRHDCVQTAFGPIRVKVGSRHGQVVTVAPEFEDCAAAAMKHAAPLRAVIESASRAWAGEAGP
jgi:uncharacterized protein (DUF111 family)